MFLLVALWAASAISALAANLTIPTSVGTVTGFINSTTPHVRQFWGVPFAQPPVGDLRWTAPVPPSSGKNVSINATTMPASCSQGKVSNSSLYTHLVPEYLTSQKTSEDCLYLNIYAPLAEDFVEPLPVLIWIHGGAFQTGGLDSPYLRPTNWVNRTKDVIVVSVNYRVNIFGFPNAAGLNGTDLNLGIMDVRLAVQWIRENIAAFGGDPQKLVLWGQSAGGATVDIYNFAYRDSPLVNGFICDSAAAMMQVNSDTAHSKFTSVAKGLGCANMTSAAQLSCMKKVPAQVITDYLSNMPSTPGLPDTSFTPIPDGKIVFTAAEYTAKALAGNYSNRRAMIMGSNSNEGASLASFSLTNPNTTEITQRTKQITCPISISTGLRANATNPNDAYTFRYQYQGNFTNVSPAWWMGAYHSAELPLIFGTSGEFRGPNTPFEADVSAKLQDVWVTFARDGGFGLLSAGWPDYNEQKFMILFGKDDQTTQRIQAAVVDAGC